MSGAGEMDWWSAYPLPAAGVRHVRMNFVTSADGAVTIDGRSGALGGAHDRELMRVLRSLCDAVLVGAGTVRAEGYGGLGLSADLRERRVALGLTAVPRMVIASGSLDLTPDMSVFAKAEERPIVITRRGASAERLEALRDVAEVVEFGDREVDLGAAFDWLASQGLARVLCEGGPGLFGSLLAAELVDEVCLTVSPLFVAGEAPRIAHSLEAHPTRFRVASVLSDDESFVFLRYERATSGA